MDRTTHEIDKKIVSTKNTPSKTETKILVEAHLANNSSILLKTYSNIIDYDEKTTIYQFDKVEKRKLRFYNREIFDGPEKWKDCLGCLVLPIALPVYLIMSIDKNYGPTNVTEKSIVIRNQHKVPLNNGILSISIPTDKNKANVTNLNIANGQCTIKYDSIIPGIEDYKCIIKANSNEHKFVLKLKYDDGFKKHEVLEGSTNNLKLEVISFYGSDAAFQAKLQNFSKNNISLSTLSDNIYFIDEDGKSVKGELDFYYSDRFQGNYPNLLPAQSYIVFNIRTHQSIFIKSVKKAIFKIDDIGIQITLKPNEDDKRKITKVTIGESEDTKNNTKDDD